MSLFYFMTEQAFNFDATYTQISCGTPLKVLAFAPNLVFWRSTATKTVFISSLMKSASATW